MTLKPGYKAATGGTIPAGYRYHHFVTFEDTNLVGNVYFARYVSWQGKCRELFLKQHAPDILADLRRDLRLITLSVKCDFFSELHAFDELEIRMSLSHVRQNRIGMSFDYVLCRSGVENIAARGFQEICCMRETTDGLIPCTVPPSLANALASFR